jgi:DNA transformation protein
MEKKLRSVGIHSAESLREIGSKEAVFRLKAQYPSTCVVILYHLEAALQGVEMKELDSSCKAELKTFFNQIKDC